jgi:hypothetical protein
MDYSDLVDVAGQHRTFRLKHAVALVAILRPWPMDKMNVKLPPQTRTSSAQAACRNSNPTSFTGQLIA